MYSGPSWEGGIKPERPAPPKPPRRPEPLPLAGGYSPVEYHASANFRVDRIRSFRSNARRIQ